MCTTLNLRTAVSISSAISVVQVEELDRMVVLDMACAASEHHTAPVLDRSDSRLSLLSLGMALQGTAHLRLCLHFPCLVLRS